MLSTELALRAVHCIRGPAKRRAARVPQHFSCLAAP